METIATFFVYLLYVYFGAGFLFALLFLVKGMEKVDASVKGSSWGFRLLMFSGATAFWPLLLQKWRQRNKK
ncbi:MAG: hypothetical protein R3E32_16775 [Chitinophagales bacterium]